MWKIKRILLYILFLLPFFFQQLNAQEKFLSLKKSKVNVRYGPGFDYPIKYIYKKINLTVKEIDKKENFRKIIDIKKNTGWIHISQLKRSNSIITTKDKILFKNPSTFSKPIFKLEKGRLLIIKKCKKEWCSVKTGDYSGWIKIDNFWGSIN